MSRFISALFAILLFTSCKKQTADEKFSTVTICDKEWMVKNLDVDHYRNGDLITHVTNPNVWTTLITGAWCYFNNDPANESVYGKLYNWYAVNDPRGLAPVGWHIPSDAEWTTLSDCLGGESVAGGKMKETGTTHWQSPNTDATNSSGFTGLPGGLCNEFGGFVGFYIFGGWWSSTASSINGWYMSMGNQSDALYRYDIANQKVGLSIRCLKDY